MKYIFIFVVIALICCFAIPIIVNKIHPQNNHNEIFKKLERERDSLKRINIYFKSQVDSVQFLINKKDSIISERKDSIIYLTIKKDEKIKTIYSLSNNQLYDFFTKIDIETSSLYRK